MSPYLAISLGALVLVLIGNGVRTVWPTVRQRPVPPVSAKALRALNDRIETETRRYPARELW